MEIMPIGLVCLLAAAIAFARPLSWGLIVLGVFLPLQTAAAINLWSAGGISLISAHLLIAAIAAGVVARPKLLGSVLSFSLSNRATILLALFVAYGAVTAIFMPRLFVGAVQVYSLERPPEDVYFLPLIGLRPTSGNITQTFYMAVNLIFFAAASYCVSRPAGIQRAAWAVNVATAVHLFFAAASAAPPNAVITAILDFVRTANYEILTHHTMAGFARIIGSYAEPSAFGSISIGLFAWNLLRFFQTRGLWHFVASISLSACIVVSFSTTAYAVTLLLVMIWSLHTAYKLIISGIGREQLLALFMCAITAIFVLALLFFEPARELADTLYERLFGEKMQSESGIERSAWNRQGLENFKDTFGLGVGLGSARTSGLVTTLLGNTGVIGTLLYGAFLLSSILRRWPGAASDDRDHLIARRLFVAARGAALALLLTHIVSGGTIDGGLFFFLFAAVATGAAYSLRTRSGAPDPRPFALPPRIRAPRDPDIAAPATLDLPLAPERAGKDG